MLKNDQFSKFFRKATGYDPYPYQVRLATDKKFPDVLHLPTGSGKTHAIFAAWLWRREYEKDQNFPKRLVYCLPVRVLVEQTYEVAKQFVERAGFPKIGVYKLLGGEVEEEWHFYPEKEAILIGTQDMLLSRALNRGFAQNRFAWPLDFAFLNNDCLWVFDEIQLMGSGLATSTQLAAFREHFGVWGKCKSVWLSATLNIDWFRTVDFQERVDGLKKIELLKDDLKHDELKRRIKAKKVLSRYGNEYNAGELAQFLKSKHRPGTNTLAILNTVERATELYLSLRNAYKKDRNKPEIILIHSRFRGAEREEKVKKISERTIPEEGRIIVSTQVVEAGVDISSALLFTELAPWSSIVQRLGRCNRYGEYKKAEAFWMDLDEKNYKPYEENDMDQARKLLNEHEGKPLSPILLQNIQYQAIPKYRFVIRKKDIEELFDNTPDLTGFDIDVSRFIRDTDTLDLQVFWRDFQDEPDEEMPAPSHREICPVPFYDFRTWLEKAQDEREEVRAYVWDYLEGRWMKAKSEALWPGTLVLLHYKEGGYDNELGWDTESKAAVMVDREPEAAKIPFESTASDIYSGEVWVTLPEHSYNVRKHLNKIMNHLGYILKLPPNLKKHYQDLMYALRMAALFHDVGKASTLFQEAFEDAPKSLSEEIWAKGKMSRKKYPYGRKYFRHELVSALLVLQNSGRLGKLATSEKLTSLVAYLVAAHHGKVRCAIRALPEEDAPDDGRRYALGVWEGDVVDELQIGRYCFPRTELRLDCMELGISANGERSWVDRCTDILQDLGPFRLSYLEAIIRCADARASEAEKVSNAMLGNLAKK